MSSEETALDYLTGLAGNETYSGDLGGSVAGQGAAEPATARTQAIAKKRNPPAAAALHQDGLARLRAGAFADAADLLTRAVAIEPREPYAQINLGLALQKLDRHYEALQCFAAAQKLVPDDPAPRLNRSVSLLALGDAKAALHEASEACYRAPNRFETHYAYGQAWLAANEPRRAAEAFGAALRLAPRFADAWVSLGVARYRQDNIEGAKAAMRSALIAEPGHRAATSNLAAFLRITGEYELSESLLRDLLARDPDAADARLNLAVLLLAEDKPAEVVDLLDAPPPAETRLRQQWLLQRSIALLVLGRAAEAEEAVRGIGQVQAPLAPLLQWRQLLLAHAAGDIAGARALALKIDATLHAQGDAVLPEHRIMGRHGLARFWSAEGEPDKAFANWSAGNAQLRRLHPFSREAFRGFIDADIAAFSAARFAKGPRAGNTDAAPVFIVGMPRTGTTLLEQILASHRDVRGAGERLALEQAVSALAPGADLAQAVYRIAALDAGALDLAAEAYLAELHALAPDARYIVDKMPANFRHLGLVGLMLPGARIIHCVRDPRDVGLSIFTRRFHGNHPYAHDLADLGWYIGEQHRLMAHWRAALPNSILTLRLDDWVADFEGTLARVLEFLDLPHDPVCERFYEVEREVHTASRAQVRQPVNGRGLGRWRAYARQLAPLIAELEAAGALDGWREVSEISGAVSAGAAAPRATALAKAGAR
jgi:tetratricopeptide (TPR) repeat protein